MLERVRISLKTLVNLSEFAPSLINKKRKIRSTMTGNFISHIKGRGMDFDESRPYQAGDDIRHIDWRVTARTNKTHSKIFKEERDHSVFIAVDYRPAMHFATRGVFKTVQSAKIASLLAWSAQHLGDKVGGLVFGTKKQGMKSKSGRYAVLRFLGLLIDVDNLPDEAIDFNDTLSEISHHSQTGFKVYIISDFRGFNKQSVAYLSQLAKRCSVALILISDPLEQDLPKSGEYRFVNKNQSININTHNIQSLKTYQKRYQNHLQFLSDTAKKLNLSFLECKTTDNPLTLLQKWRQI